MFNRLKGSGKQIANLIAGLLAGSGVTPTQLTIVGFLLNVAVAVVLATGSLRIGGVLLLVAGAFDSLDGALARTTNRTSVFGAFLDSTLDRYSEAALLLGLLYDASRRGDVAVATLTFVVIVGSLMVSYCRARAEGLGLDCEIGIAPRPERVILLGAGLILGLELPALVILAVLTHVTAIQRILHVYRLTEKQPVTTRPLTGSESRP